MKRVLETPLTKEIVQSLSAGDQVLLSGTIYTARDAAHAKLVHLLQSDQPLPLPLKDQIIYYVGPAPAKPGEIIGSAGPTTSYRMDDLTLPLLKAGLTGMIGKGSRNAEVVKAMQEYPSVYFAAIGGAGALIANCITESEVIAFEDLGPEAIRRLTVEKLPLTVVIDAKGNDLYQMVSQSKK